MSITRRQLLCWGASLPVLALARNLPALASAPPVGSWRVVGAESPHQRPFDLAMRQFMEAQRVSAGQLAIVRNGELILNRAYRNVHAREHTERPPMPRRPAPGRVGDPHRGEASMHDEVTPASIFRLASCSKLFTCAAITQLHAAGRLTLDERVFPMLGITSSLPQGTHVARFIDDITVKHLVDHAGGWVSGGSFVAKDGSHIPGGNFDPVFSIRKMSLALNLRQPLSKMQMARYMAGRRLQFEPGKQDFGTTNGNSYSNFGYVLLGMVVEKVTGKRFIDFVRDSPLARDGTDNVFLSHTRADQRLPREVWYEDPNRGPSALDPRSNAEVPFPYGGEGWLTELMDSGGGLATNAATLAHFISKHAVWDLGGRAPGSEREGSMAGTTSYAYSRPNGVDCAVIFNTRHFEDQTHTLDKFTTQMRNLLDHAPLA